jgi:Txe/YoeB family toxin of Txe-Axe toxin-antitoxin module
MIFAERKKKDYCKLMIKKKRLMKNLEAIVQKEDEGIQKIISILEKLKRI